MLRAEQESSLHRLRSELDRLTGRIGSENTYLREQIDHLQGFHDIIGESPALSESLARILEVAPTDATVLLTGETGTGKELFARALHERSTQAPAHAGQRELRGAAAHAHRERAVWSRAGRIYRRRERRVTGASKSPTRARSFSTKSAICHWSCRPSCCACSRKGNSSGWDRARPARLTSASSPRRNRDLEEMAAAGKFRTDLLYRLNVFPIRVPTLRERRDDMPRLVWYIIHRRQRALRREIAKVPASVMDMLQEYDWPGNVRELENVIERAMIRSSGDTLDALRGAEQSQRSGPARDRLHTRRHRTAAHPGRPSHDATGGSTATGNAAAKLGLHPNTLRFRMKKLAIARPASVPRAS